MMIIPSDLYVVIAPPKDLFVESILQQILNKICKFLLNET